MGAVSCDKWLAVKPYDKISQDELLSTEDGFIKFLNGEESEVASPEYGREVVSVLEKALSQISEQ